MNPNRYKVKAKAILWGRKLDKQIPIIRITAGPVYALIPYKRARALVDSIHDICDQYEREQRKEGAS